MMGSGVAKSEVKKKLNPEAAKVCNVPCPICLTVCRKPAPVAGFCCPHTCVKCEEAILTGRLDENEYLARREPLKATDREAIVVVSDDPPVSSFLGGEGMVCKFIGQGTVWCQSHNAGSFGTALGPSLKSH